MKFVEEAKTIVKLVGGEKNINNLVHCATRLRFELKNEAKADKEALESLPYVMKVIASGGQYQVVIGPDVNNYYNAILSIANIGNKKDNKESESIPFFKRAFNIVNDDMNNADEGRNENNENINENSDLLN